MLSVVCWRWGSLFERVYVERLGAMLSKHLRIPHRLFCVTDDSAPFGGDIVTVQMPTEFSHTPRCRRRMQQYSREFAAIVGPRMLSIDLDVVIVDDITPLVNRPEPLVCWKVNHAQVYSGSFVLMTAGVLDGLYREFAGDPEGYPRSVQPTGVPSDQAMLNHYLRSEAAIPFWTEADGFVTYYGAGYEGLEHFGVGPRRTALPKGARIVVLGSADKAVMDRGAYPWVREHWSSLPAGAAVCR